MKVIKGSNLPARVPTTATVFWYMVIDFYNAPEWVLGVYIALFAIYWIAVIIKIREQDEVDIFKDTSVDPPSQLKKTFLEKLEERMKNKPVNHKS